MDRFPYEPYAFGWYQIDYADQLKPNDVRPFRAFGREFVLWRDAEGTAHLFDAYCPHLGAHLGHGGRVQGTELQCPFHGWRFDQAGRCSGIPYSPDARLGGSRAVTAWPVVEQNGLLLGWWHPEGQAPGFETPVLPEYGHRGWSRYRRHHWRANTVWQEIQENIVDSTHFHYLHGVDSLAVVDRCQPRGRCWT
ncbi:Rieske 2Fe-2S domain-containing protein [Tistrella bauzanensis]